ncbi:hypothetical protein CK203_051812 [Vitis vinifera]|uniref:Uncharacterized protein n=1 Tax=Vitis vinifera TaxID=29760 RepID=A0A438GUR5_VITVI|nr:hypothetical protein CK203_051812 [Vitis vinifera]
MGAIRLDQDKFYLTQENRQISFFPMPDGMDRLSRLGLLDRQTNPIGNSSIGQMINHTQCLSDNLDDIYTQKSMSISRYNTISDIDKRKSTVDNMVRDSCTTTTNDTNHSSCLGRSLSDFSEARQTCIQLAQHQHWHRLWETTKDVNTLQKPIINYRRGGTTALVGDLEGMSRSANRNNHIWMALSTTSGWPSQLPRQYQAEVPTIYELPKGFVVPKFTMYDGMSDPFDHIMHVKQLMTLNIRNDALMCKIFKQSISSSTLFLEPTTMDNLFRRADKYTMLEDDVRVGSQQVLVGRLKRYVCTTNGQKDETLEVVVPVPVSSTAPRVVINCIHGGSIDEKHSFRQQRQRQMGYSPSALENPGRLLSGFNGATITSLGNVVLPVQANPITLSMQFSMVDDLSPYNAIMGCA